MTETEVESDNFTLAKEFYQRLSDDTVSNLHHPENGEQKLTANIIITKENKEVWQNFENNSLCNIIGNDGDLRIGQTYKIERNPSHHTPKGIFANDLDVIKTFDLDSIKDGRFYIGNIQYCHQDSSNKPDDITSLINLARIKNFLEKFSNWPDKNRVIFFASDSLEIELTIDPSLYDANVKAFLAKDETTNNLELTEEWLEEKGSTETHRSQRKVVVANALCDMLKEIPISDRFISFIRSFNQVIQRSQKSYALYMEDFSYSVFEKQLNEKAINFYEKISKSVLDIRNQILSLPISFILYSFLRTQSEIDQWFIFGMTAYCTFLMVIIYQQIVYLKDIKQEVEKFYNSFDKITDSKIRAEIDELNDSLTTRAASQNKILLSALFISFATAIILLGSTIPFSLEWLHNLQLVISNVLSSAVQLLTEHQIKANSLTNP